MGIIREVLKTHQEKLRNYLHETIILENADVSVHTDDLKIESNGLEYLFTVHHQFDMPRLIIFKICVEDITYFLRDDKTSSPLKITLPEIFTHKKNRIIKTTIGEFIENMETVLESNDIKKRMKRLINTVSDSFTEKEYSIQSFMETFIKNLNNNEYAKFKKANFKLSYLTQPEIGNDASYITFVVKKDANFYAFKADFDNENDIGLLCNPEKQDHSFVSFSISRLENEDSPLEGLKSPDIITLPFTKFLNPSDSFVSSILEYIENLNK